MPMVPDNGPYGFEPEELSKRLARQETEYLVFSEVPFSMHGGKTRRWQVLSKSSGTLLGRIKWYGPWRQFCFFPEPECIFNQGCLNDIESFLSAAMRDWRASKKATTNA